MTSGVVFGLCLCEGLAELAFERFIRSFQLAFCDFGFACFLGGWRRQRAGDALVQVEQ
jgi:hypothetical protein